MNPVRLLTLTGGLSSETRSLVDAMTVKPTSTRMRRIDRVIRGLKQSGVWDKLDVFYMLAAHDSQAARLNWKTPGTYTLTVNNSPVFTADRGYQGDGVSGYLSSTLDVSTAGGQYALNSAVFGVYVNAVNSVASGFDLTIGTTGRLSHNAGLTGYGVRVNDGSANLNIGAPTVGHFAGRRNIAGGKEGWKNGVLTAGPDVVASTALSSGFALLGTTAGASPSNARLSAAYLGGAPTDAQMAEMNTHLLTYLQGVGAA